MTKEQAITAIKECAAKLGYAPSSDELKEMMGVSAWAIKRHFRTYRQALAECDLERHGKGYTLDERMLFMDWAMVTRQLGRVPKQFEYEAHGKHKARGLVNRCGGWRNVPRCILEYIRKEHLEDDWKDVLEVILAFLQLPSRQGRRASIVPSVPYRPRIMFDKPMYGAPILSSPLGFAPINESGVVFLFGAVARQMGIVVIRVQPEFPDCEALRQVDEDRWQRVLIEFEYESRNFLLHQHRVEECDMIVCWRHNWKDCPLEVLELKTLEWQQLMGSQYCNCLKRQ